MSAMHFRDWAALAALSLLLGCSSDDGAADDTQNVSADAGATNAQADAGPSAQADAGEPASQLDASSPDGSVDSCGMGKVSCDDSCIDVIPPTGSAMIERVFAKSCGFASSCHGGTSPKQGLALDTVDHLFSTSVSQPSRQSKTRKLIEPGSPDSSYLLDKLLGRELQPDSDTGEASEIMPQPPSDPLCKAKIDAVRAWIEAGAPR